MEAVKQPWWREAHKDNYSEGYDQGYADALIAVEMDLHSAYARQGVKPPLTAKEVIANVRRHAALI